MRAAQDEQLMRAALAEARLALAEGEFPVGCVLAEEGRILAQGRRRNSGSASRNELDHAEAVALRSLLAAQPSRDCRQITCYSTLEPCLMCYSTMLLSGIRRFVWAYEDVMGGGTSLPLDRLAPFYQNMQVELLPSLLRSESIALFAQFFQNHSYWQDSLLSKFTLAEHQRLQSKNG
ncbi:nucleoside deaminase [Candidatus Electronema sp. TJ]|uniref:nucleoside deaminase n=1 Tax=Candidatus Electronema sp. TJ TaxID=3401573 RepID=UPI003AA93477